MRAFAFYRRWLKTAFWHSVGPIDLGAGIGAIGLAIADHYLPDLNLMSSVAWQLPLWIAGVIVIVRLIAAPFWIAQEDAAKIAALSVKQDNDKIIEYLNIAREQILSLAHAKVGSEDEYKAWLQGHNVILQNIETNLSIVMPKARVKTILMSMPKSFPAFKKGGYEGNHSITVLVLLAISEKIGETIERLS